MLISAVIPCFNGEKFIADAIRSINEQSFLPIEIVVVDDGSTDSSLEIVEKLKISSKVSIVVVSQQNRGVSVARNIGISTAKGDWIAFLDVDDIWLENNLQQKVNMAKKVGMSNGLICNNYFIDELKESAKKHNASKIAHLAHDKLIKGPEYQKYLIEDYYIGTATAMMFSRLDAIRIGGFDCFMKHSEDFDFVLRFTCEHDVLILSESLALKRHHGENLSNNKELYFYSHGFSCWKNLQYINEYSRGAFSQPIRDMLKFDLDRFTIGYCNEVFEKSAVNGIKLYIVKFFSIQSVKGLVLHSKGFLKKLIRVLSFGLIKNRQNN